MLLNTTGPILLKTDTMLPPEQRIAAAKPLERR